MTKKVSWETNFDISKLPTNRQTQVRQALNWLELHFPDFNEMMYEIQKGIEKGTIKRFIIRHPKDNYEDTRVSADDSEVTLDFKPRPYLGLDGKIYDWSLNETLVHEFEHIVQAAKQSDKGWAKAVAQEGLKVQATYKALAGFLSDKGVHDRSTIRAYCDYALTADAKGLNPTILNDTLFKKTIQEYGSARLAQINVSMYYHEDGAVDRQNVLHHLLGKSPRGSYFDYDGGKFQEYLENLQSEITVYTTEPPAQIRQRGHKTWPVPAGMTFTPMATLRVATLSTDYAKIQNDWNNKWNLDTKNITSDEWRIIQEVKGKLLTPEALATISPERKAAIDRMIDGLKKTFNQTSGNDTLTAQDTTHLAKSNLGAIADKAKPKGWKLD